MSQYRFGMFSGPPSANVFLETGLPVLPYTASSAVLWWALTSRVPPAGMWEDGSRRGLPPYGSVQLPDLAGDPSAVVLVIMELVPEWLRVEEKARANAAVWSSIALVICTTTVVGNYFLRLRLASGRSKLSEPGMSSS